MDNAATVNCKSRSLRGWTNKRQEQRRRQTQGLRRCRPVGADIFERYVCSGTLFVCAFAAHSLYWHWGDWDERDRGDPADDGVFGLGLGFETECGDGSAGGNGG